MNLPGKKLKIEDTNLLLGTHIQMVQEQGLFQEVGMYSSSNGFGRATGSLDFDNYLLHRKWNIPEMIFNQNPD